MSAITVLRRALWCIALLAVATGVIAYSAWKPMLLIASAGAFIILLVVDLILHNEEVERRLPPHGPVRKWGYQERTFAAKSPYWTPDDTPPVGIAGGDVGALICSGRRINLGPGPAQPPTPWWRRLPVWFWCLTILITLPVGALYSAANAHALSMNRNVTVTVTWTGAAQCVQIWVPTGGSRVQSVAACTPDQTWSSSYIAPVGTLIGADPEMSGADTMACTLAVNGDIIATESSARGDGHEVTCLGWL